MEAKQTSRGHFTVTPKIWSKLVNGAMAVGEQPILHVELRGLPGEPTYRFVVVLKEWFDESGTRCIEGLHPWVDTLLGLYPRTLPLHPPAVALTEQQFIDFKAANESSGSDL